LAIIEGESELLKAMTMLAQPRTDYQLEHFVVGKHETEEMRYAHCVLNIKIKYNALRRAKIQLEKIDYQIKKLKKKGDKLSEFKWRDKEIDREECVGASLGAMRELNSLVKIWKKFEHKYTREEINSLQGEYWDKRITRQANDDIMATGRIGKGNLEALGNIGKGAKPELDHIRNIEQNYLEEGDKNIKVMVAVATKDKAVDGLPCLKGIDIPTTIQRKYYNCYGRSTAEAYNDIAMEFLKDGADLLFIMEDDTFPPSDVFIRLYEHIKQGKKAVGGWYPKRQERYEGTSIVLEDGKREFLTADGEVHEVKTLPMGCVLYTAECFYKTTHPYFVTTEILTQDSFFSQKLREAGIKMYCDTSIRCKHIDRVTGKVYE
jgi:hypothetical protein